MIMASVIACGADGKFIFRIDLAFIGFKSISYPMQQMIIEFGIRQDIAVEGRNAGACSYKQETFVFQMLWIECKAARWAFNFEQVAPVAFAQQFTVYPCGYFLDEQVDIGIIFSTVNRI